MVRQVVLFTPGDERRMVEKALDSDADVVILDVEDAVAPSAKDVACETISSVLRDRTSAEFDVEVTVRINPLGTRGADDVALLADASDAVEGIVLPKVRGRERLEELSALMDDHGFDAHLAPIIETPQALMNIQEITEHAEVDAVEFGAEDFTTELGAIHTDDRTEILYARQKIVTAAEAAGIDAIDMAWPNFQDTEGLRRNAEEGVQYGYDGKSAIHPIQIDVIREAFTPDDEEVEWAERVVDGAEEARKEGKVTFQLDGEMIDPPIIERAEDVLERARVAEES